MADAPAAPATFPGTPPRLPTRPPGTPPPAAPPPAEAEKKPEPEKADGAKQADQPFRFKFDEGDKFSVDQLLVHGYLEGTVHLQPKLTATFRTLSVEDLQKVESVLPMSEMRDKTGKFVMNEMTIAQLYHSLVALNGKAIPPVPPEGQEDKRRSLIRQLPGVMFDLIVEGYNEFDRRAKALLTGESLRNF